MRCKECNKSINEKYDSWATTKNLKQNFSLCHSCFLKYPSLETKECSRPRVIAAFDNESLCDTVDVSNKGTFFDVQIIDNLRWGDAARIFEMRYPFMC